MSNGIQRSNRISFDTQSHAFKSEKKAIVAPVAFILFVQFILHWNTIMLALMQMQLKALSNYVNQTFGEQKQNKKKTKKMGMPYGAFLWQNYKINFHVLHRCSKASDLFSIYTEFIYAKLYLTQIKRFAFGCNFLQSYTGLTGTIEHIYPECSGYY